MFIKIFTQSFLHFFSFFFYSFHAHFTTFLSFLYSSFSLSSFPSTLSTSFPSFLPLPIFYSLSLSNQRASTPPLFISLFSILSQRIFAFPFSTLSLSFYFYITISFFFFFLFCIFADIKLPFQFDVQHSIFRMILQLRCQRRYVKKTKKQSKASCVACICVNYIDIRKKR